MFNFLKKSKDKEPNKNSSITILVVEDTEVDRRLIEKTLENSQYTVVTAVDGEIGLKLIKERAFDLIILDFQLPGCSGIDVCQFLKNNPATKDIPVIFLTTIDGGDIVHFYEAGAEVYLHKPVNPKQLLKEVEFLLAEANSKSLGGDKP